MATVRRALTVSPMDVFQDDQGMSPGLIAQLGAVLFQPGTFFHNLVATHRNRHWLWVALLILLALSFAAVQQPSQSAGPAEISAPPMDMPFDGPFPTDGGVAVDTPTDPSTTWIIGLKAASVQILHWVVLALLLSEVTLFNGYSPRLAANLQIVIWATVPLVLMILLQMLYITAGGTIGKVGLTGFLESWDTFAGWNIYLRSFAHGLASHVTLFWLWSLLLTYIAARRTLHGGRLIVILVIAAWVVILGIGSGIQSYQMFSMAEQQQAQTIEIVPEEQATTEDSVDRAAIEEPRALETEVNLP